MDTQGDWTSTARGIWLWPVAILLSFPIGGYIADLVVNGVDSVGTAVAGGLIAGAIIGAAECSRGRGRQGLASCSRPGSSWRICLENMRGLLRSGMTERDVRKDAIEPTR
jgi:hypothetical protein